MWEAVANTLGLRTSGGGGKAAPGAGGSDGAVGTTEKRKKENKLKTSTYFEITYKKFI